MIVLSPFDVKSQLKKQRLAGKEGLSEKITFIVIYLSNSMTSILLILNVLQMFNHKLKA